LGISQMPASGVGDAAAFREVFGRFGEEPEQRGFVESGDFAGEIRGAAGAGEAFEKLVGLTGGDAGDRFHPAVLEGQVAVRDIENARVVGDDEDGAVPLAGGMVQPGFGLPLRSVHPEDRRGAA
jgi:hypothetical protein